MEDLKAMQQWLDHRTEIENQAIELMKQLRYDEANELLKGI